jgi:general secretion pathway protein D
VLLAGALLPAAGGAQPAVTGEPSRIYGIEVEPSPARDRVLVFADGLLRPQLSEVDAGTVMLSFPGSRLDPSAPRRVDPEPGGAVHGVTVFETADEPREVRVTVLRSAGVSPSLSQRGGQVALDFRRPGRVTRPGPAAPLQRTLDARWLDVEIITAIERLARFLDRRVILDEATLTGSVSIEAPDPITRGEAAQLFDALLLLKGLAAVAGPGDALKVLPLATFPGPWVEALDEEPGGAALVTLIHLNEMTPELAAQAVEPLVGKDGLVQVYPPSNALLVAGVKSRLVRITRVLRQLDREGATRVVLIPLHYADAEQTEAAISEAFEGERSFDVWSDERTQRLIVRARHQTIERVREFVARVDRPAVGRGEIQVIPVQYADPEQLAKMLRDLAVQGEDPTVRGAESLAGRDFGVSVHAPTHSLVVQADPSTIAVIRSVVAEIDRLPERVMVEVGVTEVSLATNLALSFDAIVPLVEPKDVTDLVAVAALSPSGNAFTTSPSSSFFGRIARSPILLPIVDPVTGQTSVLPIPRETAVVTADASEVRARLLQRPKLLMASGEEQEIFVGDNIPVPTAAAGGTNPLRTSQNVERRDAGVDLRVRPTVPEEGPVALDLSLEVSAFSGASAAGPTFIERKLDAVIRLESGRSAVIASAELPRRGRVRTGVPFLMDIPFLGWLFRSDQEMVRNTHLIITLSAVRQHPEAGVLTSWMLQRLSGDESDVAESGAPGGTSRPAIAESDRVP